MQKSQRDALISMQNCYFSQLLTCLSFEGRNAKYRTYQKTFPTTTTKKKKEEMKEKKKKRKKKKKTMKKKKKTITKSDARTR